MNPPHYPDPSPTGGPADLSGLNAAQREAVTHGSGPLLVLAGAGSGKTRVITHRITHLIRNAGLAPARIVAVTFTNKAATEMRERVEARLEGSCLGCWIGTFHALCLRLLRREGGRVGLAPGFIIYDSDDQLALVKRILKEEVGEDAESTPRSFLSRISRAKNSLEDPEDVEKRAFSSGSRLLARVYRSYDGALRQANAVDFDDLLLRTIQLFKTQEDVLQRYAERCEHLLVDEYQDTNRPQYLLIRQLSSHHGNVCVVGDEDQSIYRFRGAEIRNILEFEQDHPGTRTIRLEQNYRSSGTILNAASALIANNVQRKGKTLWTENAKGEPVELFRAPDDRLEAIWVSQRVRRLVDQVQYEDVAVLYRTNAQSRLLEEIFRRDRIPYQVVGSIQFYERKEIKDLLAYLKLASNPADPVSFRRVVNTPSRGIGASTLGQVEILARELGSSLTDAAARALIENRVSNRPARMLRGFLDLVAGLKQRAEDEGVAGLLEHLIEVTHYEAYIEKSFPGQSTDRMENVRALVSAAVEYAEESEEEGLQGFLDRSALVAGADEVGGRPGVTLMTIHCAKGLEFPVVFITGLEENLFPHAMCVGSPEDVEEERRLCYVAMTRAKERMLLSHSHFRRSQGTLLPNPPSRFLEEIPQKLLVETAAAERGFFDQWDLTETALPSSSSATRAVRRRSSQTPPSPPAWKKKIDHADGFAIGVAVRHPQFGGGTILDREGSGKHLKLTIHFSDHGRKKILPSYTTLQVRVTPTEAT